MLLKSIIPTATQVSAQNTLFPFNQSIRWHRKPRWLPVAKTKMFRIPERPKISDEEYRELSRIHKNYHTQMRAVRRFFHEEMMAEKTSLLDSHSEISMQEEANDFERSIKLNEEWNRSVSKLRDIRIKKHQEERELVILNYMSKRDEKNEQRIASANERIKKEKEESKHFIMREDLDAAIENALNNPVDYNFAIDLNGNVYNGREANSSYAKKSEPATPDF